jgi:hypothetical protein
MEVPRLRYHWVTPAIEEVQRLGELCPLLLERKCLARQRCDGRRSGPSEQRQKGEVDDWARMLATDLAPPGFSVRTRKDDANMRHTQRLEPPTLLLLLIDHAGRLRPDARKAIETGDVGGTQELGEEPETVCSTQQGRGSSVRGCCLALQRIESVCCAKIPSTLRRLTHTTFGLPFTDR